MTITGSGFGTKATAAPVIYDDGSGGYTYPTQKGWSGGWPTGQTTWPAGNLQYRSLPYMGVSAPHSRSSAWMVGWWMPWPQADAYSGYNVMSWMTRTISSYPQYAYASWYYRIGPEYVTSRADWNLKTFDWSFGGTPYSMSSCFQNNWYLNYAPTGVALTSGTSSMQHQLNDDTWGYCSPGALDNPDQNGHGVYWGSDTPPFNGWHKFEIEMVITDQTSGHIRFWDNGVQRVAYVGSTDAWTMGSRSFALGGYSRDASGTGTDRQYIGDAYVDWSLQRVVICPGAIWSTRGVCHPIVPSAWTDTSVTGTVHLGTLSDTGTAYVYVTDADGVYNTNGYSVALGGDTTAPAAPMGLGVQ